jgi:hypothetical protein
MSEGSPVHAASDEAEDSTHMAHPEPSGHAGRSTGLPNGSGSQNGPSWAQPAAKTSASTKIRSIVER